MCNLFSDCKEALISLKLENLIKCLCLLMWIMLQKIFYFFYLLGMKPQCWNRGWKIIVRYYKLFKLCETQIFRVSAGFNYFSKGRTFYSFSYRRGRFHEKNWFAFVSLNPFKTEANQWTVYLRRKSRDWFLYDNGHRLERVKCFKNNPSLQTFFLL